MRYDRIKKKKTYLEISNVGGCVKRSPTIGIFWVDVGFVLDENSDNFKIVLVSSSNVKRSWVTGVGDLIMSVLEKTTVELDRFWMIPFTATPLSTNCLIVAAGFLCLRASSNVVTNKKSTTLPPYNHERNEPCSRGSRFFLEIVLVAVTVCVIRFSSLEGKVWDMITIGNNKKKCLWVKPGSNHCCQIFVETSCKTWFAVTSVNIDSSFFKAIEYLLFDELLYMSAVNNR